MNHSHPSAATYFVIYIILLVLMALTVGTAYIELGPWHLIVAMTIAVIKAALILLYFMHLRYSGRAVLVYAFLGFAFLMVLLVLSISDYLTRGWIGAF
jgi:cytochrome c oxidase subunit IV